jgi:hypothetical protein
MSPPSAMTSGRSTLSTSLATTTQAARLLTGTTKAKLKTAVSLTFLTWTKTTHGFVRPLKTGLKTSQAPTASMASASTLSPRSPKTSGLNLAPPLVSSKWVRSSTATLPTSVPTKTTSLVYSTTQCTTPLTMCLVMVNTWGVSSSVSTQRPAISKILMPLACSLTTTTTHVSSTTTVAKTTSSKLLPSSPSLDAASLSFTTAPSSTIQAAMTPPTVNLCGKV